MLCTSVGLCRTPAPFSSNRVHQHKWFAWISRWKTIDSLALDILDGIRHASSRIADERTVANCTVHVLQRIEKTRSCSHYPLDVTNEIHCCRCIILHSANVTQVDESIDVIWILPKDILREKSWSMLPLQSTHHDALQIMEINEIKKLYLQSLVIFVVFELEVIARIVMCFGQCSGWFHCQTWQRIFYDRHTRWTILTMLEVRWPSELRNDERILFRQTSRRTLLLLLIELIGTTTKRECARRTSTLDVELTVAQTCGPWPLEPMDCSHARFARRYCCQIFSSFHSVDSRSDCQRRAHRNTSLWPSLAPMLPTASHWERWETRLLSRGTDGDHIAR